MEFTLVLPILLLLLVTIADFGRYFATGIQIESAARAAAEVAAAEYLGEAQPLAATAYERVHAQAWQSVCDELSGLPNASPPSSGPQCDGVPTIVCVHDGADPGCGAFTTIYNAASGVPAQCTSFAAGAMPTNVQAGGADNKYVEVQVCYRFSTIFRMSIPFFGLNLTPLWGDFFIERDRVFTVADY